VLKRIAHSYQGRKSSDAAKLVEHVDEERVALSGCVEFHHVNVPPVTIQENLPRVRSEAVADNGSDFVIAIFGPLKQVRVSWTTQWQHTITRWQHAITQWQHIVTNDNTLQHNDNTLPYSKDLLQRDPLSHKRCIGWTLLIGCIKQQPEISPHDSEARARRLGAELCECSRAGATKRAVRPFHTWSARRTATHLRLLAHVTDCLADVLGDGDAVLPAVGPEMRRGELPAERHRAAWRGNEGDSGRLESHEDTTLRISGTSPRRVETPPWRYSAVPWLAKLRRQDFINGFPYIYRYVTSDEGRSTPTATDKISTQSFSEQEKPGTSGQKIIRCSKLVQPRTKCSL